VPLTSTAETFSHLPLHEGRMADAALRSCHITVQPKKAQPRFAMPPKNTARFPRSARLLRHADFERVYKQGRRHFSASMTVFYWPRPEVETLEAGMPNAGSGPGAGLIPGLRVGFTVSRALGGAVQRNRMKRRLREAVRMTLPPPGIAADVVINPKKSLLTTDFAEVLNEVTRAFAVIEQKLSQTTSERTPTETSTERPAGARSPKPGGRKPEAESRF
jgi:ribonuclease P protein component